MLVHTAVNDCGEGWVRGFGGVGRCWQQHRIPFFENGINSPYIISKSAFQGIEIALRFGRFQFNHVENQFV